MKSIDWKKVSSDKDLSSQYAVNVFNRFSSSSHLGSDNIDSIYNNLLYPHCQKKSNHAKIRSVQTRVSHQLEKTLGKLLLITTNKVKLAACKCALDNAYSDAEVAFINGKINELSSLHINQHSAARKTVNELSGKGCKPPTPTLKVGCREKRLENWLSHFKNLGKLATLPEKFLSSKFAIPLIFQLGSSPLQN